MGEGATLSLLPSSSPPALAVQDAVTSYGAQKVVDGLTLTVAPGTVYALLGPSGCGKTTLLLCVLARKALEGGSIRVLGGRPGDRRLGLPGNLVGFMPQTTSLFMEFTVSETFSYFGRLLGMDQGTVAARREELLELLELPRQDREVRCLSGGQQRRLSLAAALLHSPKLLVLDEPTVGVDPLVRQRVWRHLQHLAREQATTTIVTTHYVEEARAAHRVGFMREGRLLAEDSPQALIEQFSAVSLEEVFLTLCQAKDTRSPSSHPRELTLDPPGPACGLALPSLTNILALLIKNWITMKRSPILLIFVFFLPGILMVVTCLTIGLPPLHLPVGVLNLEANCSAIGNTTCDPTTLSCHFLSSLAASPSVHLVPFAEEEEMAAALEGGVLRASVLVRANFSESLLHRLLRPDLYSQFQWLYGVGEVGKGEKIRLSLDTSDTLLAMVLREATVEALLGWSARVAEVCSSLLDGQSVDLEVVQEVAPGLGKPNTTFQQYVMPAFCTQIIYFLAMALTSESFIAERAQGLLERSWLCGVLPVEILASHILSQFWVIVIQVVVALLVVFGMFQIPCHGPILLFALLALLQGLAGMSYGFFLSAICNTSTDAIKLAISSFIPVLLLTGFLWPVEGMAHDWMREAVWYLPQTAAIQGLRDISLRGWGLGSAAVQQGILISSTWTTAFLILSYFLVRNKI